MTLKNMLINLSIVGVAGVCAWYLKPTTGHQPNKAPTAPVSVLPSNTGIVPEADHQESQMPIQPNPRQSPSRDKDEKAKRLKEARDIVWEMSNADAKAEAMIRKPTLLRTLPMQATNKSSPMLGIAGPKRYMPATRPWN